MFEAKDAREKQVSLVGSETLYNRLDNNLADLEVDPFFYKKQCQLFVWRWRLLDENTNYSSEEVSFLSSQCFDNVIRKLNTPDLSSEMPEIYLSLGREAISKFLIPGILLRRHLKFTLHIDKEDCLYDCVLDKEAFRLVKQAVRYFPESVAFIDLAIRYSSIRSLKTVCMAKVVELGLAQDCLPLSVQETFKNGPELGEVDRRAQRGLQMLEMALKDRDL